MTSNTPFPILGTAQLMSNYGVINPGANSKSRESAHELLHTARDVGIAALDSAPAYDMAEEIIGEVSEDFIVHTKVAFGIEPLRSLKTSLGRLNRSEVDVLYFHDIQEFRRNHDLCCRQLAECLDNGAKRVGVSVYDVEDLDFVHRCKVISVVQLPLNVLDRRFANHIRRLNDSGIAVILRSVFLQGVLLSATSEFPAQVKHLEIYIHEFHSRCIANGVSPIDTALAFCCTIPGVHGIIVGAQSSRELVEISKAFHNATSQEFDIKFLEDMILPNTNSVDPRRWKME